MFDHVESSESCVEQIEYFADYVINITTTFDAAAEMPMPMLYNFTNAMGTLGPLARNCYAASDASASSYGNYIPSDFGELMTSIRMNIILN